MAGALGLQLTDDGGNDYDAVKLSWKQTTAATATRTSQFELYTSNSGSSGLRFTVKGNGQVQHNGYGSGTFTGTATTLPAYDASGNLIETSVKQSFTQTSSASVVANDNETTLISTGVGTLTIPANRMVAGKTYRITVRGKYNTDASNPAQMNWRLKFGSTVILASGNAGLGTNKVDKGYEIHADFTCRTTGSSGSVMAQGMFFTEDGPGAKNMPATTTTINTTVSNTVDFTVDLTDGSAGNSCYVYILIFEEVN
jgi:hypothetical protein